MRNTARLGRIGLTVWLLGCSASPGTPAGSDRFSLPVPAAISQVVHPQVPLQELPQVPVGETVQVEGTVLQQAPLLESRLYQIADDTGKLWIRTLDPAPEVGATVRVQGLVQYEAIVLNNADIGEYYLQETSRTQIGEPPEDLPPESPPTPTAP
jgi:hypothetical protein